MHTPQYTAIQLVQGIKLRSEESLIYRFQMSMKGLSALANRERIDDFFLTQLASELFSQGWCMFQVTHTSYCFISIEKSQKWRKLSGSRIVESIQQQGEV